MTLMTWEPVRRSMGLQHDMARLVQDAFAGLTTAAPGFEPPVDIVESGDSLVLVADLPGVTKGDLELSVENRTLTLAGERKAPTELADAGVFSRERVFGRFSRVFSLPTTVDIGNITAEFKDGVLRVDLPKAEAAKPRRIEVRGA